MPRDWSRNPARDYFADPDHHVASEALLRRAWRDSAHHGDDSEEEEEKKSPKKKKTSSGMQFLKSTLHREEEVGEEWGKG
jgi:hypothetical protein